MIKMVIKDILKTLKHESVASVDFVEKQYEERTIIETLSIEYYIRIVSSSNSDLISSILDEMRNRLDENDELYNWPVNSLDEAIYLCNDLYNSFDKEFTATEERRLRRGANENDTFFQFVIVERPIIKT